MKLRETAIFCAVSLALLAALFGPAMSARQLMAPLDIAPALFSKYRWVDPEHSGVPGNHYIIDQLTYDLPLQREIHRAVQQGAVPWWTFGDMAGRPLLVDAHINGTDPVRLFLYSFLPFEPAYNWTLLLHSLLAGLGAFLLLRSTGRALRHAVLLGAAWQFSGAMTLYVGHPWIQATFLHYPYLWLTWNRMVDRPLWKGIGVGSILCALVFNAGNLQSHVYLPLFAGAWLLGTCGKNPTLWKRLVPAVGACFVLGAMIVLPLLLAQVDLYLANPRLPETTFRPLHALSGLASLSCLFPWALGTFKTIDASKLFGQTALGFHLFIGIPFLVLVAASFLKRFPGSDDPKAAALRRVAIWIIAGYLVAVSTPAITFLYTRIAPMATLALVVLAAPLLPAAERLFLPRIGRIALAGVLASGLVLTVLSSTVLVRLVPKVEAYLLEREAGNRSMDSAPTLRKAQASRLVSELSLRNPELSAAIAGIGLVAVILMTPPGRRPRHLATAVWAMGLLPVLLFHGRFVQSHDISLWNRLQEGGPEQRAIQRLTRVGPLRISDESPGLHDKLFPNCLGHLYGVQTVHGYAALRPPNLSLNPPSAEELGGEKALADIRYRSAQRDAATGETVRLISEKSSRFLLPESGWSPAPVAVIRESVDQLVIEFDNAAETPFLLAWTDSFDPGWSAEANGARLPTRKLLHSFTQIEVPAGAKSIRFRFHPTRIATLGWPIGVGLFGVLGLILVGHFARAR